MTAKSRWAALLILSGFTLGACAPHYQRVSVDTLPGGAEVFLQRSGEMQVNAAVPGFYGSVGAPPFREEYRSLGTSPVDYEFLIDEQEATVAAGGVYGEVKRHYTEGRIRVVKEGYRIVERAVRFTGDRIVLELELEPADELESEEGL